MDRNIPRPGEIYNHFKDKPYQIITVALDSETGERMVVYQALYGAYKTYVRSLAMFMSEVDHVKYPDIKQKYRFELRTDEEEEGATPEIAPVNQSTSPEAVKEELQSDIPEGEVSLLLMKFLDADTYSKKLEVLISNKKHLTDRLITDMSVALDLTVDEGPLDQRINGLINCLQAMCRFENRRLR